QSAVTRTLGLASAFDPNLIGWVVDVEGGTPEGGGTVTIEGGYAVLREGDSFRVSLERTFTVPDQPTTLSFTCGALAFDTTAQGFIRDAFEAALVDPSGASLLHTIGAGRDAFFNVTEGVSEAAGQGTTVSGRTVTADVSGLTPGTTAKLIFRLVNNDGD